MKIKLFLIAGLCVSTSALAGGYRVALQGQSATGMGHVGTAMTESAEVVFFNPAGMSFLESKSSSSIGVSLIDAQGKYQNKTTNKAYDTNNPIGTPFYIYQATKINEKSSLGFGIYTPYGNSVEWPLDWAGSHLVNNISLKTIYAQPTFSYKINNTVSIGAGPTFVNGYVHLNRNLSTSPSVADKDGKRSNVTIKGSGITAWGYTLGILAKPNDNLSLGMSFRSQVDMEAKNRTANFSNIADTLQSTYPNTTYDATLILPAELSFGASYSLGSQTTIAFELNRTFWSAYESLDFTFESPEIADSTNPRKYSDSNIYRIGVQHNLSPKITVRVGSYYDQTPISDGYFTPETARNSSVGLTLGGGLKLNKRLSIETSFVYLHITEFNGSYDFIDHDGNPSTPPTSFGGDYLTNVTIFGLGLNYNY